MPEATEAFARLHPEVDVQTEFGSNDRVFEMTAEGEVDFGLVSFPKSTKQLQFIPWQQEPMRIGLLGRSIRWPATIEVSLAQLMGIEMIGFDRELDAATRNRSMFWPRLGSPSTCGWSSTMRIR